MSIRVKLIVVLMLLVSGIVLVGCKKQDNSISKEELKALKASIVVTGIIDGDQPMAVISGGDILEIGDTHNGIKIVSISSEKVECEKNGTSWTQEVKKQ